MRQSISKIEKGLALLFAMVVTTYLISFFRDPRLFVIAFFVTLIALIATGFFIIENCVFRLLPDGTGTRNNKTGKLRVILLIGYSFLVCYFWLAHFGCLPRSLLPPNRAAGLLSGFVVLLATWSSLRHGKAGILCIAIAAMLLISFAGNQISKQSCIATEGSADNMALLKTLPYLSWAPADGAEHKTGVIKYDREGSYKGLNLFVSRTNPSVISLLDMGGKELHTWSMAKAGVPRPLYATLCNNGDLLVLEPEEKIARINWDSAVKWMKYGPFHHELAIAPNGDIYTFAAHDEIAFHGFLPVPVGTDSLVVLSAQGDIKEEIPLFEIFKGYIHHGKYNEIYHSLLNPRCFLRAIAASTTGKPFLIGNDPFELFHANSIQVLNRDIKGVARRGDLLLSLHVLDTIAIYNRITKNVRWSWGQGYLSRQHHPSLLENGNILIFDNGIKNRASRILEINPLNRQIVWKYAAEPPEGFFTMWGGASQRLPNGNTLITETDKGHVFEVTKNGDVAWEFYHPYINAERTKRGSIYRMLRIIKPENYGITEDLFIK